MNCYYVDGKDTGHALFLVLGELKKVVEVPEEKVDSIIKTPSECFVPNPKKREPSKELVFLSLFLDSQP